MADDESASETSTYGSLTAEEERVNGETEQDGDGHHETVAISERQRRKYNEALRELYELAKLRREEMETEESAGDDMENNESETGRRNVGNVPCGLEDVHRELMEISRKLQMENEKLFEQEMELRQREVSVEEMERMVRESHSLLEKCAEQEVNKRWAQMTEKHQLEQSELEETVRQKVRENKRLKLSYETVRQANDALKQQLAGVQEKNQKLETQLLSVQRRVTNLQRKNEFAHRQRSTTIETPAEHSHSEPALPAHKPAPSAPAKSHKLMAMPGVFEVIPLLFDWITAVHQRERDKDRVHRTQSAVFAQGRCCKILPRLSDLLPLLPSGNNKVHYPCLQFIFWCLMHIEEGGNQKMALSSTLRRIGEELYRPSLASRIVPPSEASSVFVSAPGPSSERGNFLQSHSMHVRMLSSLIILKTLTQGNLESAVSVREDSDDVIVMEVFLVDHLARVFDLLRSELKGDAAKDLFLQHSGVSVILPYLKITHRGLLASAVDVFLQLCMESAFLPRFLESCSNDEFFQSCSTLLRDSKLDVKLQEKLCIILQRLSKIRANHRLFEAFQFGHLLHDLMRCANPDDAFLTLNLRSILLNLNMLTS